MREFQDFYKYSGNYFFCLCIPVIARVADGNYRGMTINILSALTRARVLTFGFAICRQEGYFRGVRIPMKHKVTACLVMVALLAACGEPPSQDRYDSRDVGMNATVLFGTVLSERQVQVTGQDTGNGALIGGVGGGVAGSVIGAGNGSILTALGGALIGMYAGNKAEKGMGNRVGIEYIIALENGWNQSIVQNIAKDDVPIAVGTRVMVQTQGSYRRVLPAAMAQGQPQQPATGR